MGLKKVQNGDHPIENPKILIGAQTSSRIQNGAKIVQNGNHPILMPQTLNGATFETPQKLRIEGVSNIPPHTNPEEEVTIKEEEKIVQNGVQPVETPQILNGTKKVQNGAQPAENPQVQERSSAGKFVKIFFSKLKLFFQFLFFCALLFILFDEFLKPTLSELFWGFLGDEFYQTLIFPTPPSLQLLH